RSIASTSSCPLARPGVPTQSSATSDRSIAFPGSVVAPSRPAPTTSARSPPRPGSITGGEAALTSATLSGLASTPVTSCPARARQAAVTHPTYPSPNTLTRTASPHLPFHEPPPGQLLRLAADAGTEQLIAAADVGLAPVEGIGDLDRAPPAALAPV